MIQLHGPVIDNEQLAMLRHIDKPGFKAVTLPILYRVGGLTNGAQSHNDDSNPALPSPGIENKAAVSSSLSGPPAVGATAGTTPNPVTGEASTKPAAAVASNPPTASGATTPEGRALEVALADMFAQASQAIRDGANILILSDRGVTHDLAAIPALLAVAGLHHHLIREGTRTKIGLVLESGEPREVHHMAVLIGYGCGAINPYLAFEAIDDMIRQGVLEGMDHKKAVKNFIKAAPRAVIKTMSKMGISTMASYRGAQIFEAIGLNHDVISASTSPAPRRRSRARARRNCAGVEDIGIAPGSRSAARTPRPLTWAGSINIALGAEYHLFNPESIHKLQLSSRTNNYKVFKEYAQEINDQFEAPLHPSRHVRAQISLRRRFPSMKLNPRKAS